MVTTKSAAKVLSDMQLNRALMKRQCLLRRVSLSPAQLIEHLVGLQAQIPLSPYLGLWSRLQRFRPEQLSELLLTRAAVRAPLMRSTIHLVTGADFAVIWPVARTVLVRTFGSSEFARDLKSLKSEEIAPVANKYLREQPRTLAALGRLLAEHWPKVRPDSLAYASRCSVPVVQVPPRGVWGKSGQATWAPAETWLGRKVKRNTQVEPIFLRYLVAFGPATVADFQAWSGLAGSHESIERLRSKLKIYGDEHGRELFDIPGATIPEAKVRVPVRFLPEYDNVLLGHADRSRVLPHGVRRKIAIGQPTVLIDGFAAATWRILCERNSAKLAISLLKEVSQKQLSELTKEGEQMLDFLGHRKATVEIAAK